MSFLGKLGLKMPSHRARQRMESDMREELQRHLELETQKNVERGMTPEAARREARIAFGALDRVAEECRDSWGTRLVDDLRQDLR